MKPNVTNVVSYLASSFFVGLQSSHM
jgi:hypothetical protein